MQTTISTKDFTAFYTKNRRAIYNFIFKMTHDEMTSEELVNDVFLKVYQSISKFDETKSTLKTWVYNIASNATIDYLRKKKLLTKSISDAYMDADGETPVEMDFASGDANPLDQMIATESQLEISNAIQKLSPQQAEIISQYALGYTYEDIAGELNMPVGTVKGSMHFARVRMREMFNRPVATQA